MGQDIKQLVEVGLKGDKGDQGNPGTNGAPGATTTVYDLLLFFGGVLGASEKLARIVADRAFTLPVDLAGSQAAIGINPDSTLTLTLLKNGASIGTVTFSTIGAPTITVASSTAFSVGDVFGVDAPASADASGADISLAIKATI